MLDTESDSEKHNEMNLRSKQEYHLHLLLRYLESTNQQGNQYWQDWQITRLGGGANNQLFRAKHSLGDFVIKFTIRDERNRAEREFQALSALEEAGLQIAPMPLLLDNDSFHQPVVVQTWIEGEHINHPPTTDEQWQELLQYYQVVHSVTPDTSSLKLPKALSASTVAEGRSLVNQQLARIPSEAQPTTLKYIVRRFDQAGIPEWEKAPVTLCRIDPNVSNFIRRAGGLASVDWEYSGWDDPAFDIADLMAHHTGHTFSVVRFKATAGKVEIQQAVLTGATELGAIQVPVAGRSLWSGLATEVETVDFGARTVGVEPWRRLKVVNPGNVPVEVNAQWPDGGPFRVEPSDFALAGGQTGEVRVYYTRLSRQLG